MNKTIWMCWFQGEDDDSLSGLNRKCINRWKELNPTWQINVLSDKTIADYIPEYFEIIKNSPKRSCQACSDLVRVLLLSKYGGVWADASLYPMIPLSDFYDKIVNDTGFFTYRFLPRSTCREQGDRETVSWFICADKPNHLLINAWKESFIEKIKNLKKWKYFAFHETLAELYDSNSEVKFIIDNMIQISEQIPHSAIGSWDRKSPSYVYKRPNIEL